MWKGKRLKNRREFYACMAAVLLMCGCGQKKEEEMLVVVESANDTVSYVFVTAEIGDVELTQKLRCTYTQQKDQEISFSLTGRIVDKVYVEEGDMVKRGDLLAELSVGNLERQIEDLEYRIARNELMLEYVNINEKLEISQIETDYYYGLYAGYYDPEKTPVTDLTDPVRQSYRYQREDYMDALELDRQTLASLQQELKYCRVYAGMDGMVYKLEEHLEGSTSKEGEVVMTIVDNSECLFETEAPEYAECFREGETVSMRINVGLAAGLYELLPYNMEEWGETQQFIVYDGPTTSGIEVGTGGNIQFPVESRQQVLCLPKETVNTADDKNYVYVVDENNIRQIRWVETGLWGDTVVEITSGLEEGEKVILR